MKKSNRVVRVHYPLKDEEIVLRIDSDWNRDIEAAREIVSGEVFEFEICSGQPYFYFKPVLVRENAKIWSRGDNYLAVSGDTRVRNVYPYFLEEERCSVCDLQLIESPDQRQSVSYRVFLPPGYYENTQRRYPVLYMQDGQNLFFREEAFGGEHWGIPETLAVLDSMCAIDQVIVVGIYPNRREQDYTRPGYGPYGELVVKRLKPKIDGAYRTLPEPQETAVMGSSLGGVVSLHMAWEYPGVFGMVGCLSSTFGWRDDLFERIANDSKRNIRIYLDSGWPGDNYEVTRNMRNLLLCNGYVAGRDLLYFAFPHAIHNERAWAMRSHIPFQYFFEHQSASLSC